jgi:hypothetical protein
MEAGEVSMKKKTMTELCSKLAKREGGKHQASIGDVRELMRCFADLCIQDSKEWVDVFLEYACNRANRKARLK